MTQFSLIVAFVPFADISNAWAQVHLRQRLLLR